MRRKMAGSWAQCGGSGGYRNALLGHKARSRVTKHVRSGPRRQVELECCRFPDLVTPVRHANTSPCGRGEHRRLGIGPHIRLEMFPQLFQDGRRHLDDPGPCVIVKSSGRSNALSSRRSYEKASTKRSKISSASSPGTISSIGGRSFRPGRRPSSATTKSPRPTAARTR